MIGTLEELSDGVYPDAEKKRREMSEDLLKRARFLVVCGDEINDDVEKIFLLQSIPR